MPTELEDYDTFYQKQLLPKELRNINPNLLKLIPRTTGMPGSICTDQDSSNFEHKREVTEEEKKLIAMKYNLKRLNTLHNKEMISFKKIKRKFTKKATVSYIQDNNMQAARPSETENVTN